MSLMHIVPMRLRNSFQGNLPHIISTTNRELTRWSNELRDMGHSPKSPVEKLTTVNEEANS